MRLCIFNTIAVLATSVSTAFATIPNTELVGVLKGELSVSASGSATYTIPIAIPPGTAGVAPQLAFSYISQSGNGLLGLGWSITGFSSITRCPTTLEQDGYIDGVDFDGDDQFCLDGQRLVAISGSAGANGTEYRTELESFSKIVSYGTAGTGPAKFKVWTKSGRILEYGFTADSRIEAQGKNSVLIWALNKTSDTLSNYYTISYNEINNDGEYYPTTIAYTGNETMSLGTYNVVSFEYEARPDGRNGFTHGSVRSVTKRLNKVITYSGGLVTHEYRLSYSQTGVNNQSILDNVIQCDGLGDCFPAISFAWLPHSVQVPAYRNIVESYGSAGYKPIPGDFNGDGRTDFLYHSNASGSVTELRTSNVNGTFSAQTINIYGSPGYRPIPLDYNGDGLTDFLYHSNASGSVTN